MSEAAVKILIIIANTKLKMQLYHEMRMKKMKIINLSLSEINSSLSGSTKKTKDILNILDNVLDNNEER